jgi:RHS repeat-associated protein
VVAQRYAYNGKELVEGIGLYAYGFRYYDPVIGRFTGVDPIADKFSHVSTFNYAENSPIRNIDLHGLQAYDMASRDPGLNAVNATSAERREYQMNMGVGFGGGVLGTAAIYVGTRTRGNMGFEAITQVGVGMATGKPAEQAFQEVDAADIGMVGLEKLIPGSGLVKTLFKMAFSEAVQSSIDVTVMGYTDILGTDGSGKTVSGVTIETTVGVLAGAAGNGVRGC